MARTCGSGKKMRRLLASYGVVVPDNVKLGPEHISLYNRLMTTHKKYHVYYQVCTVCGRKHTAANKYCDCGAVLPLHTWLKSKKIKQPEGVAYI